MEVVEMVLAGSINKSIVASIQQAGGRAVGISGKDGNLLIAERFVKTKTDPATGKTETIDFGFVGEPHGSIPRSLDTIIKSDAIPVIAPIGVGRRRRELQCQCRHGGGRHRHRASRPSACCCSPTSPGVLDKDKQLIQRTDACRSAARSSPTARSPAA